LTVDKYSKRNPGTIGFDFGDTQLYVPNTAYGSILEAVSGGNDEFVSCDTDVQIVLSAGGLNFEVSSHEFQ
jgi:hypothetical protein